MATQDQTASWDAQWYSLHPNEGRRPEGYHGEGGGGGSGGIDVASKFKLKDEDKRALEELKSSKIDYTGIEKQAYSDYAPYYERILKESNYDIATAKQRLEQDYQTGVRTNREDASSSLKTLFGDINPSETTARLDDLNRRQLLGTQISNANQPNTETLPDGTTQEVKPVTTTGFGGVGGAALDQLRTSQSTRQEAITRALKRNEEQGALTKVRQFTDLDVNKQRQDAQREQERKEKATALAGDRYARAIQRNEIKRNEILDPYLNNSWQ